MKQPREKLTIELQCHQRTSRWDLIKKRHGNINATTTIKSDAVKRIIEMDFVSNKMKNKMIQNDENADNGLNPLVVMNLRHEMSRKSARHLPLATVQSRPIDAWCKQHNVVIEEHFIANELNRLRQQLEKQRQRNRISEKSTFSTQINNKLLLQSLEKSTHYIEDCYIAPIEAMETADNLIIEAKQRHSQLENMEIEQPKESKEEDAEKYINEQYDETFINANNEDEDLSKEIYKCIGEIENSVHNNEEENNDLQQPVTHLRCVRFDTEEPLKRENSCSSNTSDDIDSVISDLAEEAILELRQEEQAKLVKLLEEQPDLVMEEKIENVETPIEEIPPLMVRRLELPPDRKMTKKSTLPEDGGDSDEDDSVSNHEQSKIIEQLFQARAHTNIVVLRKYFLKWIHYVNIEKIERENVSCNNDRIRKINLFLDKIRKEKVRLTKPQVHEEQSKDEPSETPKPGVVQVTKKKPKHLVLTI